MLIFSFSAFAISKKIKEGGDRFHQYFSKHVLNYSNRIDQFFLEERELDKDNGTRLIFYHRINFKEFEHPRHETNFEIKLRLPELSKKLQLAFESQRNDDANSATNSPDLDQAEQAQEGTDTNATAAWFDTYKNYFSYKFSAGVRIASKPYPLLRLLFFRDFNYKGLNHEASAETRWDGLVGYREYLTYNFGKKLSNPDFYLRQHNDVIWYDDTSHFDIFTGPTLSHRLSDRKWLRYNFRLHYISEETFHFEAYKTSILYRQDLYKKWLFVNVGTYLNFPRALNYKKELGGFIRFEVSFGGSPVGLLK